MSDFIFYMHVFVVVVVVAVVVVLMEYDCIFHNAKRHFRYLL